MPGVGSQALRSSVMIRPLLGVGAAVLGLVLWVDAREGQAEPDVAGVVEEPSVAWTPAEPGEGTLFQILVQASDSTPVAGLHGEIAGEELHFARGAEGRFSSLAPAPVGTGESVEVTLRVVYEGGGEGRMTRSIPVLAGSYRHEELSVAPRFGRPMDEADRARLEVDREKAAQASAEAHRTPPLWGNQVVMPRDSRVTSGFGDGRIFNGQVSSRHMGLDLRGRWGDTVVAAARGVVSVVDPFLLAGNVVYLNHGGGLLSGYFHLSEQLVAVGDTVLPGEAIGLAGATGRVTGPHLHWVLRYGRTSLDPRSWFGVLSGQQDEPDG